jgi:hypothetical protein
MSASPEKCVVYNMPSLFNGARESVENYLKVLAQITSSNEI